MFVRVTLAPEPLERLVTYHTVPGCINADIGTLAGNADAPAATEHPAMFAPPLVIQMAAAAVPAAAGVSRAETVT